MLIAVAKETAAQCKLCQNSHRPEIDDLLVLRSQRKMGTPEILAQLAEWGVENPNDSNLKTHFKRHVTVIEESEADERAAEIQRIFDEHLGEGWQNRQIKPDEHLSLIRTLSVHELYRKAVAGKELGVTVDHGIKADAESTKRKSDERVGGLLTTLVGGITQSLTAGQQRALESGQPEVIDAEVVDVEE